MKALSTILREGRDGTLMFWCPGCDGAHAVQIGTGPGPRWGYNGNPDAPTFTPSILVRGTVPLTDMQREMVMRGARIEPAKTRCHSFVTEGKIRFLGDCSHALAGSVVPLPDFEA